MESVAGGNNNSVHETSLQDELFGMDYSITSQPEGTLFT